MTKVGIGSINAYSAELSWRAINMCSILYYSLTWLKPRQLKFTHKEDRYLHIVHSQYLGSWWPGDARSQGISRYDIDIVWNTQLLTWRRLKWHYNCYALSSAIIINSFGISDVVFPIMIVFDSWAVFIFCKCLIMFFQHCGMHIILIFW